MQIILPFKYLHIHYGYRRKRVDFVVYHIEKGNVINGSEISDRMARGMGLRLAQKHMDIGLDNIGVNDAKVIEHYETAKKILEKLIIDSGYHIKGGVIAITPDAPVDDIKIASSAMRMLTEVNLVLDGMPLPSAIRE